MYAASAAGLDDGMGASGRDAASMGRVEMTVGGPLRWLRTAFLLVGAWLAASPVAAQSLESVLMPGRLVAAHAELEDDCDKCHVKFDRGAQAGKCLACHEAIAADVEAGRGYHGRIAERRCSACHTDHEGRDARIVRLDPAAFDHGLTDFVLEGRHAATACEDCHRADAPHRAAPSDCIDCHHQDEPHRPSLGERCDDCHRPARWSDARFDHASTGFVLGGSHADVTCTDCHAEHRYEAARPECVSCHRADDAHEGRFGSDCASCHGTVDWPSATFDHQGVAHFALDGGHRGVPCASCHLAGVAASSAPRECVGCHAKDDVHAEALGKACDTCHVVARWKRTEAFDHDALTRFALRGRHADAECSQCHRDDRFRDRPPMQCVDCHAGDDRERGHRGRFGSRCAGCHVATGWRAVVFDHGRKTRFPLRGKHRRVACESCHRGQLFEEKLESRCVACHRDDDPHRGELGERCESCHADAGWSGSRFDHATSRFPLTGRHRDVRCEDCHRGGQFKSASTECVGCHGDEDPHRGGLGPRCGTCHDSGAWKTTRFDHRADTAFPLVGRHAEIRCDACHRQAVLGQVSIGQACIDCHRRDDAHLGSLGEACGRCHGSSRWRGVSEEARRWAEQGGPPASPAEVR